MNDLSTDSFRYLTTMQSLQDGAYFAENVMLPGLENVKLTPNKHAAWIYYGGSYAGAKAAFARKLFPDVWWGAIASSAVTAAIVDYWEYYEVSLSLRLPPKLFGADRRLYHPAHPPSRPLGLHRPPPEPHERH